MEGQINRNDLIYKLSKYNYDFRNIPAIIYFSGSIFNGKITISEADKKQSNLIKSILQFNDKARLRSKADKDKKKQILMKF